MIKLLYSLLLFFLITKTSIYAIEVVLEGKILKGKDVAFEQRPLNLKNYNEKIPYYTYANNSVAIGYNDKNVAKLAMEKVYAREDQLSSFPAKLSANSIVIIHIKMIADAASDEVVLKMLPDGQLIGEKFNLVSSTGAVVKSNCYLLAIKKEKVNATDITNAVNAIQKAIVGIAQ